MTWIDNLKIGIILLDQEDILHPHFTCTALHAVSALYVWIQDI